jgi:hypothetical protein
MSSDEATPPTTSMPVPLHAVTRDADGNQLVVKRRPGRPRVVRPQPAATEEHYIDAVNSARDGHVNADALVGVVRGQDDANNVLHQIMKALAVESASLAWEIRRGREAGTDVSQYSSRRIDALSKIAHVELGRRKLGMDDPLDPNHPRMTKVLNFFLVTVKDALETTLPAAQSSRVCDLVERRLREWASSGH